MGRGKSKSARAAAQLPMCSYGAACTRRDCVYRHPPKSKLTKEKKPAEVVTKKEGAKVCTAFLAGRCVFGSYCDNRHPDDEQEIATLLAGFRSKMCRFGSACETSGCLYSHPPPPASAAAAIKPSMANVCLPVQQRRQQRDQHVDPAAHLPQQQQPFLVDQPYYPEEQQLNDQHLQYREDAESRLHQQSHMSFQPREPAVQLTNATQPPPGQSPQPPSPWQQHPAQHLAQPRQQPETSVLPSGLIDDFDALLGVGAASFPDGGAFSGDVGRGLFPPPPQNSASHPAYTQPPALPNDVQRWPTREDLLRRQQQPPPPPQPQQQQQQQQQQQAATSPARPHHFVGQAQAQSQPQRWPHARPTSFQPQQRQRRAERIPDHLWTISESRNANAFTISDPVARFMAVNVPRRPGVMDLHFQSARTCVVVLEALLDQELQDAPQGAGGEARKVWVITGTGHHTGNTHVKAGRLLEATEEWLQATGYDYAPGRDGAGHVGAFAVYC